MGSPVGRGGGAGKSVRGRGLSLEQMEAMSSLHTPSMIK